MSGHGFLIDSQATAEIAQLLSCREDAVVRTLHMARDSARQDARRAQS